MKKLLCVLLLSSLHIQSQTLEDLSYGTPETLEVITWNIEFFPKADQATLQYVTEIVTRLHADVIAIQEIDDYFAFNDLIDLLPNYNGYYQSINGRGLGYLYRKNVVEIRAGYEILTGEPENDNFPRFPMVLEITYGGEDFVIINNHFKCCGNGELESDDPFDEETRRFNASLLLKEYIDINFQDDNVILVGDLNDLLTDPEEHNVFRPFLEDPNNYLFTDFDIAEGSADHWSYPNWPSHLDHILINKNLFSLNSAEGAITETLKIEDYLAGGFDEYDTFISDHRPVGIKLPVQEIILLNTAETTLNGVVVYPTITEDIITIYAKSALSFELYTALGQLLFQGNFDNNKQIDMSIYTTGVYLLKIKDAKGTSVVKRIVRR